MAFPFPHIQKKEKFQYTFLNEVALKIFPPEDFDRPGMGALQKFFNQLFNLDFGDIHRKAMLETRLKVGNQNSGVMFVFSSSAIQISIAQDHYNDFGSSMMPIVTKFADAYSLLFDSCKGIQLKFVDVWPLAEHKKLDDELLRALEEAVFSSGLRNLAKKIDENFKGLDSENETFSVKMKYGYYISQDQSQNSGMALESRCELKDLGLPASEICRTAREMNDVLYDAFIWAVTPDITDAMKSPKIISKD